ncbi:MAG: hypothetical protein FJ276_37180 [Planctomycetes bacterium]|nr:hypothetical protein [Planctomycetota bacterium]
MPSKVCRAISWICLVLLAMVAGLGAPALHAIPGCGHGVVIGDRILVLGMRLPGYGCGKADSLQLERSRGPGIPLLDESDCFICAAAGKTCPSAFTPLFTLVMPRLHDVTGARWCERAVGTAHCFRSRAPPVA